MKTVYINCSPKKKFCASSYFLFLQRLFAGGEKVTEKLHTPADYPRILDQLHDAQTVVFGVPLYVDGIPSSVLRFMEAMESFCKENEIHLNVYCIANNGFIEGKQNEPLMQSFEHFCSRAGLTWGGGVGIGGGVMLNVTRILFIVNIGTSRRLHAISLECVSVRPMERSSRFPFVVSTIASSCSMVCVTSVRLSTIHILSWTLVLWRGLSLSRVLSRFSMAHRLWVEC